MVLMYLALYEKNEISTAQHCRPLTLKVRRSVFSQIFASAGFSQIFYVILCQISSLKRIDFTLKTFVVSY
jgi:hypothetical protein